jgi:hypothetical protein
MIIAISVAVTLVMGFISYHVLFNGFSDFCEGLDKFFHLNERGECSWLDWLDYTDGQSWSSGIRFFIFALVPPAVGFLTYAKLYINSH